MDVNKACNELGNQKYYKMVISIEVIMYSLHPSMIVLLPKFFWSQNDC